MGIAFRVTLLVVILGVPAPGQVPGFRQGSQFPFVSLDARSASLGDAGAALPGGIAGIHANPSALGFLEQTAVQYTFHRISEAYSLQSLAIALQSGDKDGWGARFDLLHFGDLDFYRDPGIRGLGYEFAGELAYGRMFSREFAAGITARIIGATTDLKSTSAFATDIGFSYRPGRNYTFGLSLRGLGSDYRALKPVVPSESYSPNLTRSISLGVVFDYFLAGDRHRLLVAFENDRLLAQSGILYKMGIEYRPVSLLALRAGMQIRQRVVHPRAGVGVSSGDVVLDYGYLYAREEGHPSHLITIGVLWK